jgi:hypothetical protein
MRDTPPPPPLTEWSDAALLEELGLALRDVASSEANLPFGERAVSHVRRVQAAHAELAARGVECGAYLDELSAVTKWQMTPMLAECLAFPRVIPAMRDEDGVRRRYRCPRCGRGEYPDHGGMWLCDACIAAAIAAVRAREPLPGMVVFRAYSPEQPCAHADSETVLVAVDDSDIFGPGYCAECLIAEQRLRVRKQAGLAEEAT